MPKQFMDMSDVLPGDGYTLRSSGEVSISVKSINRVGGVDAMTRRIVGVYLAMPDYCRAKGFVWYDEAHELAVSLADTYNLSTWQTSQVISVLSPQNPWDGKLKKDGTKGKWDGNRLCAIKTVQAWVSGGESSVFSLKGWGYNPQFLDRAVRVLRGEELDWSKSPKTYRFALLIDNPRLENIAVADTHASRIATGNLGNRYHVVQENAYPLIEQSYVNAGQILGITASEGQSGTWQAAVDGLVY